VYTSLGTALLHLNGEYNPTADAGADDETCSDTPYMLSGSATNYESVLWETTGDGTFDDATLLTATYTPGPSDISSGIATLTLNAYAVAPCGNHAADDMVLLIQDAPTSDAGPDVDICEINSHQLSGSATNYSSVEWSTSGDGTFDDNTLLNATYTPGPGDISAGSATLTLTANAISPCSNSATDDMILGIQAMPTANAGADDDVCEGQSYTLNGSATDYNTVLWSSAGDGTFDDPTILNATYTPGISDINSGSVVLTLTAYAISPCSSGETDNMVLGIQQLPTAGAGPDESICEGESHTLSGSGLNYDYVEWTTAGDGTFDNPNLLNATYTPGPGDIDNGSVELTITAYAIAPCTVNFLDAMTLTIDGLPDVPATPTGPTDVDVHVTPTSVYEISPPTPGAITYSWTLFPDDAGNLVGSGITATVTWNAAFHGFAYIKAFAHNPCGSTVSDSLEVFVYNSVGIWDDPSKDANCMIMPNPNNGSFRIEISGISADVNLVLMASDSRVVDTRKLTQNGIKKAEYNYENIPKGLYFLRIYNDNLSLIRKVIIR
jgi:hypothetical protein